MALKLSQVSDEIPHTVVRTPDTKAAARIIAIGGGKGGVGKSLVAANLSVAIAQTGRRVVLVDCDLGAANQHVLFGLDRPKPGLQGLLDHKIETMAEALTPTAQENLFLVAGTGASVGAANIQHAEKQRLIRKMRAVDTDVLIIDVGAGVSYNVLDFFEVAGQRLVVATPQVTSIQTAYSFLKGAVLRTLHHQAEKAAELELLMPATKSAENEKVSRILARVKAVNPEVGAAIDRVLANFGAQLVGNQVFDPSQAGVFHAITRMIQDFLGITVPILGWVRASKRVRESVNQRRPMMLGPKDEETQVFTQMAEALLAEDVSLDDLLIEDSGKTSTSSTSTGGIALRSPPPPAAGAPGGAVITVAPGAERPAVRVATGETPTPEMVDAAFSLEVRPPTSETLDPYIRKSPRYEVDWLGSLQTTLDDTKPVKIREISEGGVVVSAGWPLAIGDDWILTFEELPLKPSVAVRISRGTQIGFVAEGAIPQLVVQIASASSAPSRLAG